MLDRDLAELYGVETKVLNQAVRRNLERFPEDFMIQLTREELKVLRSHSVASNLKSQIVTSRWGGRRKLPFAFTEQGVAMLSSVLKSKRAVQVNIAIMRTFVRLKQVLATHKDLAQKLTQLEDKFEKRCIKNEAQIQLVFDAIRKLIETESKPKNRMGFRV
ncbi:MAG: ORF6N domain-containing protein [Candidatus Saganbacteria bacterium]|nr:ORF6N domain-containing protein [Candidatus Saganbacteria bacterium]